MILDIQNRFQVSGSKQPAIYMYMLIGCVRCAEEEKEIGRKRVGEKRQRIKELVEWEIKAESKR